MRARSTMPSAGDGGYVAAFTLSVLVALVWLVAIVLDGGRWIRTQSNTFSLAAAAARTGAQQIDETAALQGELRLDETAAQQAALDYLAAHDLTGTVTIDGLEVTVAAHTTIDFQLLPMGSASVDQTATARATTEGATP